MKVSFLIFDRLHCTVVENGYENYCQLHKHCIKLDENNVDGADNNFYNHLQHLYKEALTCQKIRK